MSTSTRIMHSNHVRPQVNLADVYQFDDILVQLQFLDKNDPSYVQLVNYLYEKKRGSKLDKSKKDAQTARLQKAANDFNAAYVVFCTAATHYASMNVETNATIDAIQLCMQPQTSSNTPRPTPPPTPSSTSSVVQDSVLTRLRARPAIVTGGQGASSDSKYPLASLSSSSSSASAFQFQPVGTSSDGSKLFIKVKNSLQEPDSSNSETAATDVADTAAATDDVVAPEAPLAAAATAHRARAPKYTQENLAELMGMLECMLLDKA